jgi:hypothetical protein
MQGSEMEAYRRQESTSRTSVERRKWNIQECSTDPLRERMDAIARVILALIAILGPYVMYYMHAAPSLLTTIERVRAIVVECRVIVRLLLLWSVASPPIARACQDFYFVFIVRSSGRKILTVFPF